MQKAFLCNRKKRAKLLSDSVELTQMIQGNSGMIMSVARLKVSFRASKKKNRKSIKKQFTWHGMVWYGISLSLVRLLGTTIRSCLSRNAIRCKAMRMGFVRSVRNV